MLAENRLKIIGGMGLAWFILAMALPANKLYQQGLVLFLWLPSVLILLALGNRYFILVRSGSSVFWGMLALWGWALLSLSWTEAIEPVREFKRIIYSFLFINFFIIVVPLFVEQELIRLLRSFAYGLSLISAISILNFYIVDVRPWHERIVGIGLFDHPILGAYAIGVALVWLVYWTVGEFGEVSIRKNFVEFLVLVPLVFFVVLSQSRGAYISIAVALLSKPLWSGNRWDWIVTFILVVALGAFSIFFFDVIEQRGLSFRPQIFIESLHMITQHPWLGLGVGADYSIYIPEMNRFFDHSHNMFTHIGIQLGILGMLLWLGVWCSVFYVGWRNKNTNIGRGLLGLWVYSSAAMQFDAASFWSTPRPEWMISWLPLGLCMYIILQEGKLRADKRIKVN